MNYKFVFILVLVSLSSNLVQGSQGAPPKLYYTEDFSYIMPFNTTVIDTGVFKTNLINSGNSSVRIKSIKIFSGYIGNSYNCTVITALPAVVKSLEIFSLETNECIIGEGSNYFAFYIDMNYDLLSDNGMAIKESEHSSGRIAFIFPARDVYGPPLYTLEHQWLKIDESGNIATYYSLDELRYQKNVQIITFLSNISAILFVLGMVSLAIFRKHKRITDISKTIILLILLEVFIYLITGDSFLAPIVYFLVPGVNAEIV